MSSISSRIISIYNSRNTLLEQLEMQDYHVDDYLNFTMNEVDAMMSNDQLDMLLHHKFNGKKIYIKYYFTLKQSSKQIKKEALDGIIDDLYTIDEKLTKKDTLVVVIDDEPNDTILTRLKYLYDHDGIFVVIHNIKRLQFNILMHQLVPLMEILSEKEESEFMTKHQIKDKSQLPEISRFDPHALVVGVRPGNICRIERTSATSLTNDYYRVCV
jgi:DNA-directed RNA polymerase subunit H (RpoH/RPB5)